MATNSLRPIALLLAAAATSCAIATSFAAQPPRPSRAEPAERPSAPPQAELEPGYLGLVSDDRREQGQGVRVVRVIENSPAEKAGFAVDDVIVAVGGQPTGSLDEMATLLRPHPAGDRVRFEVRRGGNGGNGGKTQTLEVELGRRPARGDRPFEFGRIPERLPEPQEETGPVGDAAGSAPGARPLAPGIALPTPRGQLLGIRTAPVTADVALRLRLPDVAGARVISRVVGSPADMAGIPLEAVIVAVDDEPVASPADLARLITAAGAGKAVQLTYSFGGQRRTVRVTLANDVAARAIDATPLGEPRTLPRPFDEQFAPAPSAAQRIEQLERRIRELELRLHELERALDAPKSAPPGRD
jgi:hypothetical protein